MFMPPVFPAHWHVSQPVLIADTFSSLVWKASLPDGTPAIVKGLKPIIALTILTLIAITTPYGCSTQKND
uniref:Streptomycin resistance protein n=1 Tax=Mannheimia varigena TaxID=85404 RepID=Q8RSQ7_9PAST|nr:streptomycin resistance protein [Mannheimia varigena]